MQDVIAAGGYQNGDNIRVLWMPGTETAIRFKGRPSKGDLVIFWRPHRS